MTESLPPSPEDEPDDSAGAADGDGAAANAVADSFPPPPGASVYTPDMPPGPTLNPRSCVTCRRRKVRCDKRMPCSNCRRAHISCVFPAPGRAPRRPRPKDPNAPTKHTSTEREIELMKRLRKLEGIVEELSGQIELETARNQSSSGNSPETASVADQAAGPSGIREKADGGGDRNLSHDSPGSALAAWNNRNGPGGPFENAERPPSDKHKRFGRLVINDQGRTRYVSSAFWSKITDDLVELRNETQKLTDEEHEDSDDEEETPDSPTHEHSRCDHHAFVFGYRSADVDLRPLHPLPSQIPYIWQVFQENVDPVVKILHIPTTGKLIRTIRTDLSKLTPPTEALMFSIYYAAITSLEDEDVMLNFGVEKPMLVSRYRFALEQALAKAEFLTSSDIVTLQAMTLFLVLVRRHDDTRFAWTLTSLLVRISQSIGLHRDGTAFPGLTPFQIEERRRLFWAIAILDLRSAEDQATDLTIMDRTFDTQFPLNINDLDIDPSSTELPTPRQGSTDITFSLVRYEIGGLARTLHTVTSALAPVCPRDAASTLEERERLLLDTYSRIERTYLSDSSSESNPVNWVAANVGRIIVAKMTLVIYQGVLFPAPGDRELSDEIRDRLFNAAIEIFEYGDVLNSDPRCRSWRWLFQTYTQWHAVAYILMEVTRRPWSAMVERAWVALNTAFTSPRPLELQRIADRAAVWLPFKKLFFKAKKRREIEIARLRADPQAAMALELEERQKVAPRSFASMSASVRAAFAIERWRKLVDAPPLPGNAAPQRGATPSSPTSPGAPPCVERVPTPRATAASTTEPQRQTAMELVDAIIGQRTFQADSIWLLAGEGNHGPQPAQVPFFGGGVTDLPRQDDAIRNYVRANNNGASGAAVDSMPLHPHQVQGTPLVDALKSGGWGPPWMWLADTNGGFSSADVQGGSDGTQAQHAPQEFLAELQPPEDLDVNMDEDFNWQDWGQSIRGFEAENNGIWGSHGI